MKMIKKLYRFLSTDFQSLFLGYKVNFKPRFGHGKPPHVLLYESINANRDLYVDLLNEALNGARSIFLTIFSGALYCPISLDNRFEKCHKIL